METAFILPVPIPVDTKDGVDSAVNMPFSLSFNLDEEFETGIGALAEGIIIDEGVLNSLIIAFRTTKWFQFDNVDTNPLISAVDFTDPVPADGSEIVLDGTPFLSDNAKIWEVIKDNIKMSADYGEDEDLSGHLESDEDEYVKYQEENEKVEENNQQEFGLF